MAKHIKPTYECKTGGSKGKPCEMLKKDKSGKYVCMCGKTPVECRMERL
jgi:hypothetical protein